MMKGRTPDTEMARVTVPARLNISILTFPIPVSAVRWMVLALAGDVSIGFFKFPGLALDRSYAGP